MPKFFRSIIHISSFLGKEIAEVIRQPRLILTLIFGPFIILFLFGIGYKNEPRAVRALFVADPNSQLAQQIQKEAPTISPQLIYAGITGDEAEARRRLAAGSVDLVIVAPTNAAEKIQNNQQAVFKIYHNEIDPAQVSYIQYLGEIYVQEVNRRVLSNMAQQGQVEATDLKKNIQAAHQNVRSMKEALQSGDIASARLQQTQLKGNLSAVALAVGATASIINSAESDPGSATGANSSKDILKILEDIQNSPSTKDEIQNNQSNYDQQIADLEKTDQKLTDLEGKLATFQQISPTVMISPFISETSSISPIQLTPLDFFAPGVIVLLLQHIAVTIASLSIVRERRSGTMELFRVSPITAGETLIGKYLSYLIFGVVMAAILALLLAFGLKIPMLGRWGDFAVVVVCVIFASLGYGFFISLIAETESQAVQLSMITLLLAVFFSGFFLDLRYLIPGVRVISWLLPATYGSILLQNIMLRGNSLILIYTAGLLGLGLALAILSWLLLRRTMAHE